MAIVIDFDITEFRGAEDAADEPYELKLKRATEAALTTVGRIVVPLVFSIDLSNTHQYAFGKVPRAGTVVSTEWVANANAVSVGAVGGTVSGGGNALQSAATDLKSGIANTLKAGALTATAAHLALEAGDLLIADIDNSAAATTAVTAAACLVTIDTTGN